MSSSEVANTVTSGTAVVNVRMRAVQVRMRADPGRNSGPGPLAADRYCPTAEAAAEKTG
jgi:hypothetical protein